MKRICAFLLAIACCLSLFGCKQQEKPAPTQATTEATTETTAQTEVPTEAPTQKPTKATKATTKATEPINKRPAAATKASAGVSTKVTKAPTKATVAATAQTVMEATEAHDDGMRIVKEFPGVTGVFHCYSGSAEMARQLVKMGWYIGFTGVLTFKNARKAVETAASIPLERIVIETDCPFMAPEPFRGKRNDPGYLYRMAERLAEIRGITVEEAAQATTENAKRLYRMETVR